MAITRREFLVTGAVAGTSLVVGFYLPRLTGAGSAAAAGEGFAPNAWLEIDPHGQVTIWVGKSEMGQGVQTSLPMLVAEELEADWSKVRVVEAMADKKYGDQGTGSSTSVRDSWEPLRKAGATAREMLIAAAAKTWGVETKTCRAENGAVIHQPSGRRLTYGALVATAAKMPVPKEVLLKDPKNFRLIGKPLKRLDTPQKVDGSAVFGMDVRLNGMLYATVARCGVFGGKLAGVDAKRALAVKGVRQVVPVEDAVAVVAESTWAAIEGRRALDVKWDEGPNSTLSSAEIRKMLEEHARLPGAVGQSTGDAVKALGASARKLEAVYEVPFLAHAPMEPMNCTADVRDGVCEIWVPTQVPQDVQNEAAKITGLPAEAVRVHTTLLGGGFGRRLETDYAAEAVRISKAVNAPVKVVWTREDDMQHDFYRPASYHRLSAGLDGNKSLVAWTHRIVAPSITGQRTPEQIKDGLDPEAIDGAKELPYDVPNILVDYVMANTAVPTGYWRSVYASQNAFAGECFVDEIAAAAGRDPYEFRRQLLSKSPRHKAVLELAATKAGWGKPLPKGRCRGIAVLYSFGSYVAHVAEVSADGGTIRVHRVVCAIDCGTVVNPDTVEAQMQSAIVFGLSAALKGAIIIEKGRVKQGNFDDYDVLRMSEMPQIEVHIVRSSEPCGGVGEPGVPPIAPAVANAASLALGRRIRRLPMNL